MLVIWETADGTGRAREARAARWACFSFLWQPGFTTFFPAPCGSLGLAAGALKGANSWDSLCPTPPFYVETKVRRGM